MFLLVLFVSGCFCAGKEKESSFDFQADVSKVMNILINSLYSNKDIFLRELISNAADALSKVRFLSLTNRSILGTGDAAKLDIRIIVDEEGKTITLIDRGIGMNREELIKNLGTIAHSGTQRFLDGVSNGTEAVDVIGQFGVGFYSSFLVAEKVKVTSKRIGDKQHTWTSNNAQSFEVAEDKSGIDLVRGTKIVLYLRDSAYANTTRIRDLAIHYSEFVDFPIYVRVKQDSAEANKKKKEKEQDKDNDDDTDDDEEKKDREPAYIGEDGTVYDFVHVNPQKAIWLRDQKNITDDDYIHFYRSISRDYKETPVYWSHFTAEGDVEFKSILYIPGTPPPMESTRQTSLRLYVHRVLIAEDFDEFLPRYLSFIRGIIDSDDVQLNVSREQLQESKMLRAIGKKIVRKIIQMMVDMAEKNKADGDPTYQNFYRMYHRFIKIGVAEDIPNRRRLASLLRFNTTKSERTPISLDDYISRMRQGQTEFFYIAGDPSTSNIMQSPFLIPYRRKGVEVLFLSDPIDEMIIRDMREYENKVFTCITQVEKKSLKTESEYEREKLKTWKKRFKPLANFFKEVLGNKVERVEVSTRLAADPRTPCVLSHVEGSASANMERYTRQQNRVDPRVNVYESRKVLEINPTNNLVKRMNVAVQQCEEDEVEGFDQDDEAGDEQKTGGGGGTDEARQKRAENKNKLETMARLLYDTAVFESGYIIGDSNEYAERVFDVLTRMTGLPNAPIEDEEALLKKLRAAADDDEDEEDEKPAKKKKKKTGGKKAKEGEDADADTDAGAKAGADAGEDADEKGDGTKKGKKAEKKEGGKKEKKEKKKKADAEADAEVDEDDEEAGITAKQRAAADALRAQQKKERQEREKALEQEEQGDKEKEKQKAEQAKAAERKKEADKEKERRAGEKAQEQEERERRERKKQKKTKEEKKEEKEGDKEAEKGEKGEKSGGSEKKDAPPDTKVAPPDKKVADDL